jgi:uncharacterized protein YxeA
MISKNRKIIGLIILVLIFILVSFYVFKKQKSPQYVYENIDSKYEVTESNKQTQNIGGLDEYGNPTSDYVLKGNQLFYNRKITEESTNFELLKGTLKPMHGYISYLYARDTYQVYFEGEPLDSVTPKNFKPIENGLGYHNYGVDGDTVYYHSKVMEEADPGTFVILWRTMWEGCALTEYSKDKNNVYFRENIVPNADPETFETLIKGYGKDKRGYYKGVRYIGPSIDESELFCDYG